MKDSRGGEGSTPAQPQGNDAPLPEFAKKAQDLEALKKAVDDAASVSGGLWLSYLLALFYLTIAAGSATHADLFFEKPINLLLLNVQLPIVAFFALAPLLFLALHAYTLAHLVMLTEKAKRFHAALYDQIGESDDTPEWRKRDRKQIRDALRAQLPSNVFIQFLAGPPELRGGSFGWALRAVGWVTLAIGPVVLLLLFQVQFLPYHDPAVTWTHRVALLADFGLIWWLWRRIVAGREQSEAPRGRSPRFSAWIGMIATGLVAFFSLVLATYRGEKAPPIIAGLSSLPTIAYGHDAIFHSAVDPGSLRRKWLLSDTLVLPRVDVLEQLKIEDPKKAEWKDFVFIAQNRDLVEADFERADLARIDFSYAKLTGANLAHSQMDRVSFFAAHLEGAQLLGAQLRAADLYFAYLQGAWMMSANLQSANLASANLQGARLDGAQLQGAYLDTGVGNQANLQGASLDFSQLQGASLLRADLRAASLVGAQMQGAWLTGASLQAATLDDAGLQGVTFASATLAATDLTEAILWRARGKPRQISDLLLEPSAQTWEPFIKTIALGKDPTATVGVTAFGPEAYNDLLQEINGLPAAPLLHRNRNPHDTALSRIQLLDCADTKRDSCSPQQAIEPSQESKPLHDEIIANKTELDSFRRELAKQLRALVCPGDEDTIYVVRGEAFSNRLRDAGVEGKSLIDDLNDPSGKSCPVAAKLDDDDRSTLPRVGGR